MQISCTTQTLMASFMALCFIKIPFLPYYYNRNFHMRLSDLLMDQKREEAMTLISEIIRNDCYFCHAVFYVQKSF